MTDPIETATGEIAQAQQHLDAATAALTPPVVSPAIATPADLNAALANAQGGTVLRLATTLVYPTALTLTRSITLQSETLVAGRMTRDAPAPTFLAGLRIVADDVTVVGLAIQQTNPLTDLVVLAGALRPTLDRCRVLGDPVRGAKRGIAANGGAMTIRGCYVDDCWQPAQDTQAIGGWDFLAPGLTIDDCYLGGGAQSVMLGGADPQSESRTPSQVTITNSTLSKNPAWYGRAQIKCALELKNCTHVTVTNCVLEYAGTSQGQGAYLIVITPRNQGNTAPYSTVEDVTITGCTGGHAGGILNVLGSDNVHPSGTIDGVTIADCTFTDIDPTGITGGAGRLYQLDRAPQHVTLRNLSVEGDHLSAWGYFLGNAPPIGLVLAGLSMPLSTYRWKLDGGIVAGGIKGGSGRAALLRYMPDASLDGAIA